MPHRCFGSPSSCRDPVGNTGSGTGMGTGSGAGHAGNGTRLSSLPVNGVLLPAPLGWPRHNPLLRWSLPWPMSPCHSPPPSRLPCPCLNPLCLCRQSSGQSRCNSPQNYTPCHQTGLWGLCNQQLVFISSSVFGSLLNSLGPCLFLDCFWTFDCLLLGLFACLDCLPRFWPLPPHHPINSIPFLCAYTYLKCTSSSSIVCIYNRFGSLYSLLKYCDSTN